MIDLTVNEAVLASAIDVARERNFQVPTFKQMRDPGLIPEDVKQRLASVGLWDLDPLNLFRITWHNEPTPAGGGFGGVNYLEVPSEISGVDARIIMLEGKWFPTGAHKVGAAFGCLVPRLVTGQFDPASQKAVWPSTGNYCRGGAYDSNLLACESIAILPEGMSAERFHWLESVAGEIIKTPGSESNVKEIFDKCNELRASGEDLVIFNQFDEFGNYLWHHAVTGPAMVEVLKRSWGRTTGSPGSRSRPVLPAPSAVATTSSRCSLRRRSPLARPCNARRCSSTGSASTASRASATSTSRGSTTSGTPTWPWGSRTSRRSRMIRLFNEPAGKEYLAAQGVPSDFIEKLPLLGISGVANMLMAIKFAKWYELTGNDVVMTLGTDSMEMYESRLSEMNEDRGEFTALDAAAAYHGHLMAQGLDHVQELGYYDRKRIHNLKYYTWVEQQGKTYDEIQAQWYDPDYWTSIQAMADPIDELIEEFNGRL